MSYHFATFYAVLLGLCLTIFYLFCFAGNSWSSLNGTQPNFATCLEVSTNSPSSPPQKKNWGPKYRHFLAAEVRLVVVRESGWYPHCCCKATKDFKVAMVSCGVALSGNAS